MDDEAARELEEFQRYLEKKIRRDERRKEKEDNEGRLFSSLKRGDKPLKKTKLNPVSKKQNKRNKEYKDARQRHYSKEENRVCAICGTEEHLSIHHSKGRGSLTADEEYFITLCVLGDSFDMLYPELNSCNGMGCHQGVEANKVWARENKYLL